MVPSAPVVHPVFSKKNREKWLDGRVSPAVRQKRDIYQKPEYRPRCSLIWSRLAWHLSRRSRRARTIARLQKTTTIGPDDARKTRPCRRTSVIASHRDRDPNQKLRHSRPRRCDKTWQRMAGRDWSEPVCMKKGRSCDSHCLSFLPSKPRGPSWLGGGDDGVVRSLCSVRDMRVPVRTVVVIIAGEKTSPSFIRCAQSPSPEGSPLKVGLDAFEKKIKNRVPKFRAAAASAFCLFLTGSWIRD